MVYKHGAVSCEHRLRRIDAARGQRALDGGAAAASAACDNLMLVSRSLLNVVFCFEKKYRRYGRCEPAHGGATLSSVTSRPSPCAGSAPARRIDRRPPQPDHVPLRPPRGGSPPYRTNSVVEFSGHVLHTF
ncbi:hypothetical protein EVAR_77335_1 [Eumeta japonica]|uniref:Uncharacterized protein n=1 Tax=Eumeta variegata TaxID=151549 RepID=A0A4C1UXR4_EUMVA|nr:hypothetical protein EVAR_77335_1 [Eumeta japonica]